MSLNLRSIHTSHLYGWQGLLDYIKSFQKSYTHAQIHNKRSETLLLYRRLLTLLNSRCSRLALKESKRLEFKHLFHESKHLTDLQDIRFCFNVFTLIASKIESGEYPPFPRRLPSLRSEFVIKDMFHYRKYILNINRDNIILEPGQDPPREPFLEPRQFRSDIIADEEYFKENTAGFLFPEEEYLLKK